jgi:hypothetical protein
LHILRGSKAPAPLVARIATPRRIEPDLSGLMESAMVRMLSVPKSALRLAVAAAAACALGVSANAEETLLRSFAAGAELNALGVVEASADTEVEGPQSIYAGERGEVYLLDQVNGRVLQLDPKRPEKTRSLQLPEDVRPTDMIVANESIYVWDGAPLALRPTGADSGTSRSLAAVNEPAASADAILSAFAQTGSETLPISEGADLTRALPPPKLTRARQIVNTHGRGQIVADVTPLKTSGVAISLQIKDGAALAKLKMQVRSRIGAVEVLDVDRFGRSYVLGENIPADATDTASVFVARYAANGALEGVYELPFDKQVALSRRFVTVSADGDVYFLRTRKNAVDLLGVGFRQTPGAKTIDLAPYVSPSLGSGQISLNDIAPRKGASAAVRPLTRAQAILTALQFANLRWRVTPSAYGPDPDRACSGFNRIRRPGYLHGKLNQDVVGVPYCWGCHGSLPHFAAAINAGRLAGNVCTRNDPRPGVEGVDCSAFVSACWGLATHFTTMAIPSIAGELNSGWDLLPGDALNKPGSHVMLFVRFTPDRRVEVIESSTGGCNGKVCRNIYPLGSLLARGYRPVRFRGLTNDRSAPAPTAVAAAKPAGAAPPAPAEAPHKRRAHGR